VCFQGLTFKNFNLTMEVKMKKKFSMLAVFTVAIAGFLSLTMFSTTSFAASQAAKSGISVSLSGQYIGKGVWSMNQVNDFSSAPGAATNNSYEAFVQRLRINSALKYDTLAHGMPLAAIFVQMDLTNGYNGVSNGYGTNGWSVLGSTPAPIGFNHDLNTFGLRQAYIRFITPIGAIMFGRMPVKFGMGVAVNTNADGVGDFIPIGNVGVFVGNLFGSEVNSYSNSTTPLTAGGILPPTSDAYSHIQMGIIPTIEVMSMKPMDNVSWSAWLTEAHLNQFEAVLNTGAETDGYGTIPPTTTGGTISTNYPTANITFAGLSATYAANGTKIAGEFDYFLGKIVASNGSISGGYYPYTLPVMPNPGSTNDDVNSYDIYLTASQMLQTAIPLSIGLKFGDGAPISAGHYNFTYYSQIQNTRTLFGDVIGNNWQSIQFSAPGLQYIYGSGGAGQSLFAVGSNLANKYVIMVDAKEFLPGSNMLKESLIYARWAKDSINGNPVFGGKSIGTEFDLNFTHHFSKTLAWQAWGGYVWTGSGVESMPTNSAYKSAANPLGFTGSFSGAVKKNIGVLGTDVIWNF
jgi:hypothetical protein